ncbi:MAG: AMP-binding protein [Phenylobacterium sp.]|uniref:class I adenylate-forming enzyme family protein n=1 Tax=Phenylobacterium sp. TaxID=1871053 RepID=UPI0025EE023F|nr:class I adenylate-forming enzyme family protein [Phenylobacterium sp.]MBI1197880.1 AMP-binding protein [Phenylobacterium sp.]
MFEAAVAFHARVRPRAPALVTPRRRVTYAEFNDDVNRYAAGLLAAGITPQRGIVGVDATLPYRVHVLLMALARLGVASTTLRDGRADLRITDRTGSADPTVLRLGRDWIASVEGAPAVEVPSAPREPEGLARVLLSSGSTGEARRVPLSWRRMEARNLGALAAYASGRLGVWAVRTGVDSSLGYNLATLAWSMGAAVAADHGAADLPVLMERQPTGLLGLTPLQLRELLDNLPAGFELKPRWRVVVTGAVLAPALAREGRQRLSPDMHVIYGATEVAGAAVGPAQRVETTPGAVGWPVPGVTMEVVGPDGQRLPDGETGEIRIRSDSVAERFLDDPEATGEAFRDGFFHSGDVGRRLPDGSFVIEGRADDRMNLGGIKIMPSVLENALIEHPQVRDAAAFAVPGSDGADECWVAVSPDGEVTRESLLQHLRRAGVRLPPIHFAWSESIPRSDMGKIDRQALRAQTLAALRKSEGL